MRVALQSIFISMARYVPGSIITFFCLHLTQIQLTITFVRGRIFWAFDLYPAVEGSSIDPAETLDHGVIREPAPFQFRVCPRHSDVERIIESESAYADLHLKEWEY
jgi:hypothetical protein